MYYSLGKSKYLLQNKFKDKANAWESSLQIVKYFTHASKVNIIISAKRERI